MRQALAWACVKKLMAETYFEDHLDERHSLELIKVWWYFASWCFMAHQTVELLNTWWIWKLCLGDANCVTWSFKLGGPSLWKFVGVHKGLFWITYSRLVGGFARVVGRESGQELIIYALWYKSFSFLHFKYHFFFFLSHRKLKGGSCAWRLRCSSAFSRTSECNYSKWENTRWVY